MDEKIFTGNVQETTIADAKDWLRLRAKKGAYCPCCKQYVKIYRRVLGAQMARWLIWLVRTWQQQQTNGASNKSWVDIRNSPVRGGDYAKLVHWGLIEQKPNTGKKDNGAKDTRDSGMWRPTYKGIDFVRRRISVPSHVILYDNQKIGMVDTLVKIDQCLGKKYSYQELMNAPVNVEVPLR